MTRAEMTQLELLSERLDALAKTHGGDLPLGEAALCLAACRRPGIDIGHYKDVLDGFAAQTAARYRAAMAAETEDGAAARLAVLRQVLAGDEGFAGARGDYDDIDNADLARAIDRRRGIPVALAILYIEAGRRQGWTVKGLNFPGHFLIRLDQGADRVIADPDEGGAVLEASGLRAIIKAQLGPHAELSATYYAPCGNRQILLRLQNNIKTRLVASGDFAGAIGIVETMRLIDPDDNRPLLDLGILNARIGENAAAMAALKAYLETRPAGKDRQDATVLLRYLQALR